MRKLLVILFLFIVACDNSQSAMDKYFSNCVDDYLKVKNKERNKQNLWTASGSCSTYLKYIGDADRFRYFKGKIFSAGYGA